jgi:hypothetical protein
MNKIQLITIQEYAKLKDTSFYDSILSHMKPHNSFMKGKIDFDALTYEEVRKCLQLMQNMDSWEKQKQLFELAFGLNKVKSKLIFWETFIDEYFSALNYLTKSFKDLIVKESKLLKSINHNSVFWEQAGGKKLDKFSNIMPLMQLGEIYGLYPYELKNKPYNEILVLLVANKEKAEVNYEYEKLRSKT